MKKTVKEALVMDVNATLIMEEGIDLLGEERCGSSGCSITEGDAMRRDWALKRPA